MRRLQSAVPARTVAVSFAPKLTSEEDSSASFAVSAAVAVRRARMAMTRQACTEPSAANRIMVAGAAARMLT